jgi:hypothetical protein
MVMIANSSDPPFKIRRRERGGYSRYIPAPDGAGRSHE